MDKRGITMDTVSIEQRSWGTYIEPEPCPECGGPRFSLMVASVTATHEPVVVWDRNQPVRQADLDKRGARRMTLAHRPDPQPLGRSLIVTCCPVCDGEFSWMAPANAHPEEN